MPPALILLPAALFGVVCLIVWLDYRRLGRRHLTPEVAAELAAKALATWRVDAGTLARSQLTERRGRLDRVKYIVRRNIKVMLFFNAGIFLIFFIIGAIKLFNGGEFTFEFVKNILMIPAFFSAMLDVLLVVVTIVVIFDAIGVRTMKTYFGKFDRVDTQISVSREGILFQPGGFQKFNYPIQFTEILQGDPSVIHVYTSIVQFTQGQHRRYSQEHYIPFPADKAAEGAALIQKLK